MPTSAPLFAKRATNTSCPNAAPRLLYPAPRLRPHGDRRGAAHTCGHPLFHPLPRPAEIKRLVKVLTCRFPVLRRGKTICHAGIARLPRRRGTSAMPAWHVCRAGVANTKPPYTYHYKTFRDGKMPCKTDCIALKIKKIRHRTHKVPILSIIFTLPWVISLHNVWQSIVCIMITIAHPHP